MILKDPSNDNIIAVRKVTYGSFPSYGYTKGDLIIIECTFNENVYNPNLTTNENNTQNKKYLKFTDNNPEDISDTIISRGNQLTYSLANVVEISSWDDFKEFFISENVQAYTYVRITGTIWVNTYTSSIDNEPLYRIHMNPSAEKLINIKPDEVRAIGIRKNALKANAPSIMNSNFAKSFGSTKYPGSKTTVDFYAVVTAYNYYNYQITILEDSWLLSN